MEARLFLEAVVLAVSFFAGAAFFLACFFFAGRLGVARFAGAFFFPLGFLLLLAVFFFAFFLAAIRRSLSLAWDARLGR